MWVERTAYFAKPGMTSEVLETRRRASAVRAAIGLPVGNIFVSAGGDGPDVRWECYFPTAAAHAADLAARAASAEFETVRVRMRALLARFERAVEQIDVISPLANGMVAHGLRDQPLVPQEIAFRSGNYVLKGYFYTPPGMGASPCMVLNHGSGIDKGTLDISRPGTASLLASWGIASFLPHRHGYGNSEGPGWREEVSSEFGTPEYDAQLAARLDRESEDVLAACEIVAALPDVRADHIGVMGSSFGGVNTLLSAAKSKRFRCAVEFAGAAMNWDRTPGLRKLMTEAALKLTIPIFFIQAENDYSIRPTRELAQSLEESGVAFQAKVFPAFGFNAHEGHLFERDGARLWGPEVRQFLERYL
jgi:dienelactone hydrolase